MLKLNVPDWFDNTAIMLSKIIEEPENQLVDAQSENTQSDVNAREEWMIHI